jgi:putative transposase
VQTEESIKPHAMNLRKGRCSEPLGLYLLTKCVASGNDLKVEQRNAIVSALFFGVEKGDMRLHAFVVMPDHWHALISLGMELSLEEVVESISRRTNYQLRLQGDRVSWQRGFHDRKIRQNESVTDIVRYIEYNPVRKNMVVLPEEWQWSSAYMGFSERLDRSFLGHERWEE